MVFGFGVGFFFFFFLVMLTIFSFAICRSINCITKSFVHLSTKSLLFLSVYTGSFIIWGSSVQQKYVGHVGNFKLSNGYIKK